MNNKVLIIGLLWPEPNATAAGTRMMQLIRFFLEQDYHVTFASAAQKSDLSMDLSELSVVSKSIELNHFGFDVFIKDLDPGIVIFDRFLAEEQYGWRVAETCPTAVRILDTEDLHFLRKARETALAKNSQDINPYLNNDTAIREIASIYRCDLSLVISKFEEELLLKHFTIHPALLLYLPFLLDHQNPEDMAALPHFDQRQHFMTMGNFKHQPNWDAVLTLKKYIWPLIRQKLPGVEVHVYGAYVSEAARKLHNEKEGFIIKGWIQDKKTAFKNSRVLLAPLRFGAGLKGKLIDAMQYGTPSISSSIGVEGIQGEMEWNGFVADEPEDFAQCAIKLYEHKQVWNKAQLNGIKLLNANFDRSAYEAGFQHRISQIVQQLKEHRAQNFIGQMLAHHTLQSTKYLSKWIEEKNANAR
jgi:glycosyltransferase involved in cell wall biosynthesis